MKRAEELLKKLKRLDEIPLHGYDVRGKPDSIQTASVNGELLVPRWHKRCQQYKINLINRFRREVLKCFAESLADKYNADFIYIQIEEYLKHYHE